MESSRKISERATAFDDLVDLERVDTGRLCRACFGSRDSSGVTSRGRKRHIPAAAAAHGPGEMMAIPVLGSCDDARCRADPEPTGGKGVSLVVLRRSRLWL